MFLILGHLRLQDKTGKLILIGLSHIQLTLGIGTAFYNKKFTNYKHLTHHGWITSVWELLSCLNLFLQYHRTLDPQGSAST